MRFCAFGNRRRLEAFANNPMGAPEGSVGHGTVSEVGILQALLGLLLFFGARTLQLVDC